MALLITLLAVALLTVAVMQFTYSAQVDYRRAAHWHKARQAAALADAGLELGRELLVYADVIYALEHGGAKRPDADGLGELWSRLCAHGPDACPNLGKPVCRLPAQPLERVGLELFATQSGTSLLERPADSDQPVPSIMLRIEDATARFNLNRLSTVAATEWPPPKPVVVFRELLLQAGLDTDLIGPIVDWVDGNHRPYGFFGAGAEEAAYFERDLAYAPRDARMTTFNELALVNGMTAKSLATLAEVATVHGLVEKEDEPGPVPSTSAHGGTPSRSININTAPLDVIRALDDGLAADIEELHRQRCAQPFERGSDKHPLEKLRQRVPGVGRDLERWIHFESPLFRVRATAQVDDVFQSVDALVEINRGSRSSEVIYYLPRRGPNIPGVDLSEDEPQRG